MTDFRQRIEQSRLRAISNEQEAISDDDFICPYFAVDRSKSPVCIDLRLHDGSHKAVPYSYFMEVNFKIDTGIEILTPSKKIGITGRNLKKLFEYIIAYRVRFVQANIGMDAQDDGLFVDEILFEQLD